MGRDVLEQTVRSLLEHNRNSANFVWHGGEPLLLGIGFFENIVQAQASISTEASINNFVQTNGVLLNDEWLDFFNTNNFHIGVSIDGPFEVHSSSRRTDRPDFDAIVDNIRKARKLNLPLSCLAVVTHNSIGSEQQIFTFFSDLGVDSIGFLPMNYGNKDDCLTSSEFGAFLARYFELWQSSDRVGLKIREFDEYLRGYFGVEQRVCHHNNVCDCYFTVAPSGDIYPCDCFPQTDDTKLGSVFGDLCKAHVKNMKLFEGSDRLPDYCTACEHAVICNGGCKYHRWIISDDFSQTQFYCGAYRTLYETMGRALQAGA
jgi:uncharacterized protein